MKRIVFLINFVSLFSSAYYSQWKWVNPSVTGSDIIKVKFLGENTGWALVSQSYSYDYSNPVPAFLISRDGGSNWEYKPVENTLPLNDFFMLNRDTVWGVGSYGTIRKTEDGGQTWIKLNGETTNTLFTVFFLNPDTGWVAGYGPILKTADGGKTWTQQILQSSHSNPINELFFTDSKHGWAVGNDQIIKTEDGGLTWNDITAQIDSNKVIRRLLNGGRERHLFFRNASTGWLSVGNWGDETVLLFTNDGGKSWSELNQNILTGVNVNSFHFFDDLNGVMIASGGWPEVLKIYKTFDGGVTWPDSTINLNNRLRDVCFFNKNVFYAVGNNGLISKSTNGGLHWSDKNRFTFSDFNAVFFIDGRTGWIGGEGGKIYITNDAGRTWNDRSLDSAFTVNSLSFSDSEIGWATATRYVTKWSPYPPYVKFPSPVGGLYKTSDGGRNWNLIKETDKNIYDEYNYDEFGELFFADKNTGWVLSYYKVLKTTDGGLTWKNNSNSKMDASQGIMLYDIFFIDKNEGWITGQGHVYHTTNGGADWNNQICDCYELQYAEMKSIHFTKDKRGWIIAGGAQLYHTGNGGEIWYPQHPPQTFNDIYFVDNDNGWAVGSPGQIFKSATFGESWVRYSTGSNVSFNAMTFTDAKHGWIVGSDGAVLKYSDGDENVPDGPDTSVVYNEARLFQNYPNPFNTKTFIQYYLPQEDYVRLSVYNILGEQVGILADEIETKGLYKIEYTPGQLSSGIYFIQLRAGNSYKTVKILLIK